MQVRRFYCRNASCSRRTFAERLPDLVKPHARRTRRLGEAQSRVGIAVGGKAGAQLLGHLAMPTSASTVLRLVKAVPMPEPDTLRNIGVDDWALCKSRTYGTIIVDLDRRRVVDLLPDRRSATLAAWLRQRPDIVAVARDRSTEYARGTTVGAPQALQVADRWHLLANIRQAVERWLNNAHIRLRSLPSLPSLPEDAPVPPRRPHAFPRTASGRAAGAEGRARGQALYDEVHRRHRAGEPVQAIARDMGLARATVRKYVQAASFPARTAYGPGPSIIDPFVPYLEQRLAEGCENAMALWREVRERGFAGTSRQVHRFVAERRTLPVKAGRKSQTATETRPEPWPQRPALPTSRQLAWLLVQPVSTLDGAAAAAVTHVEQDDQARAVANLARRFTALVRACGISRHRSAPEDPVADYETWLGEARGSGIPAIAMFAAGLESDGVAVRAALIKPWSSGQAEGQINRLKLIKRQSYGRAGLELLRRRMILAA